MSDTVLRIRRTLADEGVSGVVKKLPPFLYQKVWPYLPESEERVILNGVVTTGRRKLTDSLVGDYLTAFVADNPDYEGLYVQALRNYLGRGEDVVLVGGGEGVSTVTAANAVGESGSATVYEGSRRESEKVRETVGLNDCPDVVSVIHGIVGTGGSLRHDPGDAERVDPGELGSCDVLGIDADGAELSIIPGLTELPGTLIVEHHAIPRGGSKIRFQPDAVRHLITTTGYSIVDELAKSDIRGDVSEIIFVAVRGDGGE